MVTILIGDDIIQHQHLIEGMPNINAEILAALHIVLVCGMAVVLLLGFHNAPCADQLRAGRHKILAGTVWSARNMQYLIGDVGNIQQLHDLAGHDLIERLLLEGIASALYENTLAIHDFPAFFQAAV